MSQLTAEVNSPVLSPITKDASFLRNACTYTHAHENEKDADDSSTFV